MLMTIRALPDPDDEGHGVGRGGERTRTETGVGSHQEGRGQRDADAYDHKTTLPTNGRVVSWAYASASRWPRPSWWLTTPVSVLVLSPPLPTPWSSSSGSGSALIGLVAVIGRSVGTPCHGRGHGPGYRGCYPRGRNAILPILIDNTVITQNILGFCACLYICT